MNDVAYCINWTPLEPRGWECADCGRKIPLDRDPSSITAICRERTALPVGDELHYLLERLGIKPVAGCPCIILRQQMNGWGTEGCEQKERLNYIIGQLRKTARKYGWTVKLRAAVAAATTGLATQIDWTDPFPSLLREAIRRAKEKAKTMPSTTKRNLIYHICPLKANDVWKHNVKRLLKGMDTFNGKKVIAIALGPEMVAPSTVKRMFRGHNVKFLEIPNDKRLREVATFLPLLEAVQSTNKNEATFYAHTKGNSTAENKTGAMYWRNAMYQHLLYDWKNCMKYLEQGYLAVGTHKMVWGRLRSPYPSRLRFGQWMFAGTFFWFRNDAVFRSNWRNIPDDRYGAEAWLSGMFHQDNVKSVYQLWPESQFPTPSPYNPKLYKNPIADK